ncbi:MAG: tyrosine-type recombinase/integrase [Anaerolineales bacterium]|nr:tyrosine-type recombinase/integrase [Anaerolineales bacterium]
MRQALDRMAELLTGTPDALSCHWGALRLNHTIMIRAWLVENYKPATVNKMLSALRGVLKAAWLLGQMSAEDYQKAVTINSIKNYTLPAGREVEMAEMSALLSACQIDTSPAGTRDAAMIAILYGAGLRRAEVVKLDVADYSNQERLVVRGKGRKERTAWLNQGVVAALEDWLVLRGAWAGPLFTPINKAHAIVERRLTTQAVYYILQKRSVEAEIAAFSPHDLRRTFVSNLLDAGADIAVVSRMAGHANVQTTARYDRRPEEAKKRAAGLLHVPYRTRKPREDG